MRNMWKRVLALALAAMMLSGCAQNTAGDAVQAMAAASAADQSGDASSSEVTLEDEMVALAAGPGAIDPSLTTSAPGTLAKKNDKAVVDYSNTKDGYVMVQYTAQTDKRLKAQVKGPTTTYTYNLTAGSWATFPLSDGNGSYQVTVYQNTEGSKYAAVVSATFNAAMTDEFAPFTHPNQYVNYAKAPNTVAKAAELTQGVTDPLKKVELVYNYVVQNITYDKQLAASVKSGYLPVLDTVLSKKTGICFDYAAVMASILRSQNIPCKLVVGYAGTTYHAWINVYIEGVGWVDKVIYFDGHNWTLMDPTFVSTGKGRDSIMKYVTTVSNYSQKFAY